MRWLLYLCLILVSVSNVCNRKAPHIIFIVADDLGWNDVSWHNPNISTPNLEFLAREGVILNQSYVQPVCTPSRTAFMTGYFPFKAGRQNHVIRPLEPTGVSLNFTLLPQRLKELGYSTHMVGKWHLGYCNWSYTPTYRGFDSFFGYYNGAEDYYSHSLDTRDRTLESFQSRNLPLYLDFRNDTHPSRDFNGKYSSGVFAREAVKVLSKSNPNKPLFLYLPFQSVHSPLQVPFKWKQKYLYIKDANRRKYCGMVSAMDDAVGKVVLGLKEYGFFNDSVIIFTTDNGGQTHSGGNNWPLRGNKATLWEGGTRGVAFVYSKLLEKSGYANQKLMHAVDWYPTILHLAGSTTESLSMDGVNQWDVISRDGPAVRSEFIYNIFDKPKRRAAIRVGDYKLIWGFPGNPSGWIPPPSQGMEANGTDCQTSKKSNPPELRLYNIKDDPTERKNLAEHLPKVTYLLKTKIVEYTKAMVPADDPEDNPFGDPFYWKGIFTPGWCDAH